MAKTTKTAAKKTTVWKGTTKAKRPAAKKAAAPAKATTKSRNEALVGTINANLAAAKVPAAKPARKKAPVQLPVANSHQEAERAFAEMTEASRMVMPSQAPAPVKPPIADIREEAARVEAEMAAANNAAAPVAKGKARSIIVDACSRPEGATAKELFAATTWKFASWSHQLNLAAKATGWAKEIKRVDGTTRYFLTEPK
jgi:hypothetical protein